MFILAKVYKVRNNIRLSTDESTSIDPGVSIITITNRPNYINHVLNNFSIQNYGNKEMIIVLHGSHMNIEEYRNRTKSLENVKVFQFAETAHYGECCNFAFRQTHHDYIAIFDDDDYYAPNYLKQSTNILSTSNCDIVGKKSFYIYFEAIKTLAICFPGAENQYVNNVADSSMVIKRKVLKKLGFPCPSDEGVLRIFQMNCHKQGFKIYSIHKFNYVVHRHPDPSKNHSWRISEDELLKYCHIIKRNLTDYSSYIKL